MQEGTRAKSCQSSVCRWRLAMLPVPPVPPASITVQAVHQHGIRALSCPAAVILQIDDLYRWHLASQQQPGARDLSSQRHRFTPSLYTQLQRAFALTPSDGRFLDFDVFSGTQVLTFSAQIQRCQRNDRGGLEAWVAVQAGRQGHRRDSPQQLLYHLQPAPAGSWHMTDITDQHQESPALRLSTVLAKLLIPDRLRLKI